ncbi:biotin--[acetyl-CoA-carboxylase] ligase [Chungangia koreensis]|uniref:Bifunctional ligase/repressor BirA n=1 Tax=Chungangia koreensis TaxID=752657 RepID=A0ABV8X4T4_9LACT
MNSLTSEILKQLVNSGNEPISGQQIADQLKISRTAVWKHIKQLEDDGYEIISVKKKGYLLHKRMDSLHPAMLDSMTSTERVGRKIHYFDSCPTTQSIAHEEAANGAVDGTVVISEEQTAGKGRLARNWSSTKGKGIWMSIILRPDIPPQLAPQFTLVAAVAITRAIADETGVTPSIKWPNDLLINGRKCTGILTELQAEADRVQSIILGIGVNVNQTTEDFPDELKSIATSLKIEIGNDVDRLVLTAKIFEYIEKYTDLYIEQGFRPLKILWESYSDTLGKRIRASMVNGEIIGKAIGITEEGVLQIQTDDGKIHGIYSADIFIEN